MAVLLTLVAATASAQTPIARVADDAKVVDRVAQAAKRDLPADLLKRIVNEDIDLLRGKKLDQTYQYASFDRQEAGRIENAFSIQENGQDRLQRVEIKGDFVYRLILGLPNRRMLVTKNRRLWVDRADVEYIPIGGTTSKLQSIKVEAWLEPGGSKPIELPEIARQATVRVYARADKDAGYGNIVLTLLQAKVFDNADSPYADAVASAKAILRAVDSSDIPSIRSMATRMYEELKPKLGDASTYVLSTIPSPAPASSTVNVTSTRMESTPPVEVYMDLQAIEDLLTGTESEKREGLDRLHQLVRKLRPPK
ncbi:MAG: hypothetical protein ACXVIJ_01560 [Thermoanaerobaculia bacterium]